MPAHPVVQGRGHAADLGGNGQRGRSQRRVLTAMLPHHPDGMLPDLGQKLR
jgi:hypothetical protein